MGGRKYRSTNYFSPNDSNTICDVTGFKVKFSGVLERWDHFRMIPEAWNPREAQDFPVVPTPQVTYKDVRTEQVCPSEDAIDGPPIV